MGTVKEESMVLLSAAESNIEACCDHKAARGPFSSDGMAQCKAGENPARPASLRSIGTRVT